ncbi:ABC transporter subfamily F member 2-like [Carpediemonas membranifera]|uniref:ABC transporter subfamily F member 2-like n=1 Tax=Carpediemonas membranifera TaxID=201153 RepID=A0A8J6BBM1_9EUKA|nr:ABC transporter subfamily F member 2-like [Carpediemonas membranifera]|eukprot:KAG9396887.1 ABC transporter subfamily F member 2-like [Carpediemonas membranifera]
MASSSSRILSSSSTNHRAQVFLASMVVAKFVSLSHLIQTTMLRSIAMREVPIPEHLDIFFLEKEAPPVDQTPVEYIIEDIQKIIDKLEAEADAIVIEDPEDPRLIELYERIDDLEPELAVARASRLLIGLQFSKEMRAKKCHEFSGGWRMRVALAKALFYKPKILLLDDPTAHLDLEAVIWLETELAKYPHCLVMVSHSADFLDAVCNKIMLLENRHLSYWGGNYSSYLRARQDKEVDQMARYKKEQAELASAKSFVARFGHGTAKNARQAKSREKKIARMVEDGLTEKVSTQKTLTFRFPDVRKLPTPVLQMNGVMFGYPNSPILYENVWASLDMDSRVCLVGANGAGKSTLMKLFSQELLPLNGEVRAHTHLRIGRYHQHLADALDLEQTPLEFLMSKDEHDTELSIMRQKLGSYGLSGKMQVTRIGQLSDGQRVRVCFAWLGIQNPNILFLDEPTNSLDLETIDSLAACLECYSGGVLLISHDFRLVNAVANEIWICEDGKIERYPDNKTIVDYKEEMRRSLEEKQESEAMEIKE